MPREVRLKTCIEELRRLRATWSKLAGMPPEVLSHLDSAIQVLQNDHSLASALHGLNLFGNPEDGLFS